MNDRTDPESPARIEDSEARILIYDPFVLRLVTNKGEMELVMNRNAATLSAMNLVDFLGAEPMNEDEANGLNLTGRSAR